MQMVFVLNRTCRCIVNDNVLSLNTTDKVGNNNKSEESESEHGRPAPRLLRLRARCLTIVISYRVVVALLIV